MTATAAKTGYGTTLQVSDGNSPATFTAISEVVKISGVGVTRAVPEATNLTSPAAWREFVYGMIEAPDITLDVNYIPQDATQKALLTNVQASGIARVWRLLLPDYGAVTKTVTVSSAAWSSAAHGFLTGQSVTITTTGTFPGGINAGQVYWLQRTASGTFGLYNSPADAVSSTNIITTSSNGTGTITANATSMFSFTAECSNFTADPDFDSVLRGQIKFKVTGASALTP